MLFKYKAEGRPFRISLELCLQTLLFTSLNFSSRHLHDKQNNATCNYELSVPTMNTDVYILGDVPAKGNVHSAEWGFSSCSLLNDCVTNIERTGRNVTISNILETANLNRIFHNRI